MKKDTINMITKKILAVLLIFAMTMADFLLIGINGISYAVDVAETNSQNVEFSAYFENGEQSKLSSIDSEIDEEDLRLKIEITVKNEGYFNGKISLENSSFNLKSDIKSEYINKIENNEIYLNQINAGSTVILDVGIEYKNEEKIEIKSLNNETKINLSGTYVNSKKDIEIEGSTTVKINWKSPENIESTLNAEIITNNTYKVEEQNKKIVQILVASNVENNSYPIKETKIEINVPNEVEEIFVHKRTTLATNGNDSFTEANYNFDKDNSIVTINIENIESSEGKVDWVKNAQDIFVITCKYPENKEIANSEIVANSTITTFDQAELKAQSKVKIEEIIEGIISNSIIESEDKIYKGKLYTGEERNYTTETVVNIDLASVVESIDIKEGTAKYIVSDEEKNANIQFNQTKISKQEFDEIFGENGVLTIKDQDGNILANITKESIVDENGQIVINYNQGVKSITISATKPQAEGILNIEHQKSIINDKYERAEIKELTGIKEKVETKYIKNDETETTIQKEKTIELKETETKADLKLNTTNLLTNTQEKQTLKMEVVLETKEESEDLYKNPSVKITLPSQITATGAKYKLLYGNGLEVKSAEISHENNNSVITIKMTGEQTSYEGTTLNGATLIIYADVTLENLAISSTENIVLNYTNENASVYKNDGQETAKIEVVSEYSIITTNDIKELGVLSVGNEGTKEVPITIKSEKKNATVEMKMINNEGADISNISIIGKIPVVQNKILRATSINVPDGATIYYTDAQNPTADLESTNNNWKKEEFKEATSYLVLIDKMEKGKKVTLSYDIEIAENLDYNISGEASYKMSYTNSETKVNSEVESTKLNITTGAEAELTQKFTATVGQNELNNGDDVKAGEIIKYNISITNTGKEDAQNVNIKATIPEGTTLVEVNKEYLSGNESGETQITEEDIDDSGFDSIENEVATEGEEDEESYAEPEINDYYVSNTNKEIVYENVTIKSGKTVNYQYMLRVNQDVEDGKQVKSQIVVTHQDKEQAEEIVHTLKSAEMLVEIAPANRLGNETIISGYDYDYVLSIKNLSNKNIKNVEVSIDKNDLISITGIDYDFNGESKEIENLDEIFTIDEIPVGETALVNIQTMIGQPTQNLEVAVISTTIKDSDENTYRSNVMEEKVTGVALDVSLASSVKSDNQNGYVNPSDIITYTIKLKNTGNIAADKLSVEDMFSDYLTLESITLNGEKCEYEEEEIFEDDKNVSKIIINTTLEPDEVAEIVIRAKVIDSIYTEDILKIINKALIYNEILVTETEEDVYYLESILEDGDILDDDIIENGNSSENNNQPGNENNGGNSGENGNGENNNTNVDETKITHTISGTIWLDENENGKRDSGEPLLEGIKVYAIDAKTNKVLKDTTGAEITAQTDGKGFYTLKNIPEGNCLIAFEYNTEKYVLTIYQAEGIELSKNSDAIQSKLNLNGNEEVFAVTDSINLTSSVANIDLGLVEAKVFDLGLQKYVTKIVVTNEEGTKTYEEEEATLSKVEIASKYLSGSSVVIEYTIKIKNNGELSGYVKNVVDYVPTALSFNSSLNPDWYQSGEYLYNGSLANTKIEAGETKELKLVLTKVMTESNTGLINNKAEIEKATNSLGVADINSTPANREVKENDLGSADVVILVKTGAAISYITLTLSIIAMIAGIAYIVNKKILQKKIKI